MVAGDTVIRKPPYLSMLKQFRDWVSNFVSDPHLDRIRKNALDALRSDSQSEEPLILKFTKNAPHPMKEMPRAGAAWFIQAAPKPRVKTLVWVEVDDATEKVTRTWVCP